MLGEPYKGQLVHRIICYYQDFMPAGVSLRNVTERYSIVIPLVHDTLVIIGGQGRSSILFHGETEDANRAIHWAPIGSGGPELFR